MKNFERSQSELQWIRDQSRKVDNKGNSVVDSKESSFDDDDESSVDLWYNKYRKSECSMNHANQGVYRINKFHFRFNKTKFITYLSFVVFLGR